MGFCPTCRIRFTPKNRYDLQWSDFAYGPDQSAIEALKVTGPLPYIVKNLTAGDLEKRMLSALSQEAHRVTHPSTLDAMIRKCALSLALGYLPQLFVTEGGPPNAFTFGSEENPCIVLDASLLRLANQDELMAVLGHESGHVKSGHMLYHTLAEILAGGASLSASLFGLNILTVPIQLGLLAWHRESEVTADRASLLVVKDVGVVQSLLKKLALSYHSHNHGEVGNNYGVVDLASELFQTHPMLSKRLTLVREFAGSNEFQLARRKIELQQSLRPGLLPFCRYCEAKKAPEILFCPSCGKSQV